jgi:hypothetical protein
MSAAPRKPEDPLEPLRTMTTDALVNRASTALRFAHANLDEMSGALLKVMELTKEYPELAEFKGIPGCWRNIQSAREALDLAWWRIKNGK